MQFRLVLFIILILRVKKSDRITVFTYKICFAQAMLEGRIGIISNEKASFEMKQVISK